MGTPHPDGNVFVYTQGKENDSSKCMDLTLKSLQCINVLYYTSKYVVLSIFLGEPWQR